MRPGEYLREVLRGGTRGMAASARNPLSAILVEEAGFPVIWASGLELSASRGVPDANVLTMADVLESTRQMAAAVEIPVLADCDSGFGDIGNVIEMVKQFESAGVAGVCIEDKTFPKLNSFAAGSQEMVAKEAMAAKILAAIDARRDSSFVIVARIESFISGAGLTDALERAEIYERAGADALLIHSKEPHADEIRSFIESYRGALPLIAVPTTYSSVTAAALHALGIALVIYANQTLRSAVSAMRGTLRTIFADGTSKRVEADIATVKDLLTLQGMPEYLKAKAEYDERGRRLLLGGGQLGKDGVA